MSRPCKKRRVCAKPKYFEFNALNSNSSELVKLTVDEFECLRLLDYEKITQEECAVKMRVARTTVTLIYQEARNKVMDALVNGKKIIIEGGNYEICSNNSTCKGYDCLRKNIMIIERGEEISMRLAITFEENNVFMHFGKCKQFKIYDLNKKEIVKTSILDANGAGHSALADLLSENQVDALICGGIGNGAVNVLEAYGIKVFAGANGNCDEIVNLFINDQLDLNGQSNCDHHHHEHSETHECHCDSKHHCH